MSSRHATSARQVLALDIPPIWKKAFEEVVLPQYQDEQSVAGLLRRFIKEIVGCFLTEKEMRDRGLLASYRTLGNPDALLFALRRAEELRKEKMTNDVPNTVEGNIRNKRSRAS